MTGIQKYLRDECKRPEINFVNPDEQFFAPFRATLDAVMKERTAEGMVVVNHTENLTVDEEPELWGKGVKNNFYAKELKLWSFLPQLVFYKCRVWCLRGLSEHEQLQAEQFVVSTSNAGEFKITFSEFISKTVKGGGGLKERNYTLMTY